jgi:cell division protein FtsN
MLPLVGIIAIVLLVVAGKVFFLSGLEEDQSPLPRLEEFSRIPPKGNPAQAEEIIADRQDDIPSPDDNALFAVPSSSVIVSSVPSNEERRPQLDILAVPYDSQTSSVSTAPQEIIVVEPKTTPAANASDSRSVAAVRSAPPVWARPQRIERATPEESIPSVSESKAPPVQPSWMVQVGAFSTQTAANSVSQQVTKAGYSAMVVAGKNLHRVLIQAGSTREDALGLATQMSQIGFKGAFIVPPRQ